MEKFFLPSKIEFIGDAEQANKAQLIIEPLFHGYGTTIGNALRRVLLSSLPGAAITSIKIKGATHEFTAVKGVLEDILEICLNIKQLRVKVYTDEPVKLKLVKKGKGVVKAKDIEKNSNIEILNPELHIATITDDKMEFNMDLTAEKGMGYITTDNREKASLEVGAIAVDALYTPIKDVGYKVEDTRVGQITNYDKLTMSIETDGSITPKQAVTEASRILIDHFNLLTVPENILEVEATEEKPAKKKKK